MNDRRRETAGRGTSHAGGRERLDRRHGIRPGDAGGVVDDVPRRGFRSSPRHAPIRIATTRTAIFIAAALIVAVGRYDRSADRIAAVNRSPWGDTLRRGPTSPS